MYCIVLQNFKVQYIDFSIYCFSTTTKDDHSQKVLAEAAAKLRQDEVVPVRIIAEPTNPRDS